MKQKLHPLVISSSTTVIFLCIGAILVILGLFNEHLQWDIFSPQLEKILYGVFSSSVALGIFGVAITLVLGVQEAVKGINTLAHAKQQDVNDLNAYKFSFSRYIYIFLGLVSALTLLVSIFATANHFIQEHRNTVFQKIAVEQIQRVEPKFPAVFQQLSLPDNNAIPDEFLDLFQSIHRLSFVSSLGIYIPDPRDRDFMWKNSSWYHHDYKDRVFTRFFISKNFELDMREVLEGNISKLDELNSKTDFEWYFLIKDQNDNPIAVLRIYGKTSENFRDYGSS